MGPEATIDLYTKIVKGTKVKKDQNHLRIFSLTTIPKFPTETLAIKEKGAQPSTPINPKALRYWENAGADFHHHSLRDLLITILSPFSGKNKKFPILHLIRNLCAIS